MSLANVVYKIRPLKFVSTVTDNQEFLALGIQMSCNLRPAISHRLVTEVAQFMS